MGSSTSQNDFNVQHYQQNSGLSIKEVEGIKNVFDSLDPQDGLIRTGTLRKLYRDSYDAPQLNNKIGDRETLTFDQFFELMKTDMLEKKKQFPGVDFDDGIDVQIKTYLKFDLSVQMKMFNAFFATLKDSKLEFIHLNMIKTFVQQILFYSFIFESKHIQIFMTKISILVL